jgi:hypothetical protein
MRRRRRRRNHTYHASQRYYCPLPNCPDTNWHVPHDAKRENQSTQHILLIWRESPTEVSESALTRHTNNENAIRFLPHTAHVVFSCELTGDGLGESAIEDTSIVAQDEDDDDDVFVVVAVVVVVVVDSAWRLPSVVLVVVVLWISPTCLVLVVATTSPTTTSSAASDSSVVDEGMRSDDDGCV